jgi:hypothetical protein
MVKSIQPRKLAIATPADARRRERSDESGGYPESICKFMIVLDEDAWT